LKLSTELRCCFFVFLSSYQDKFRYICKSGMFFHVNPLPVHPRNLLILGSSLVSIVIVPDTRPQAPSDLLPHFVTFISLYLRCLLDHPVFGRVSSITGGILMLMFPRHQSLFHPMSHYITRAFMVHPFMDHSDPCHA
jgi:hypothetical protein